MIVSWKWLQEYVDVDLTPEEIEDRLTMSGLNHEGTEKVADDLAIDLEVTSNRPDCLGHIGVAREIAVLTNKQLQVANPQPATGSKSVTELAQVEIACPDLCPRYTARVIEGIKIGPSPQWLADRLRTLGIAVINNVVDISNYVMMECGQPLHAFDYDKLHERKIIVRRAQPREKFVAIDHRTYELTENVCVIADGKDAVALGGVMGGAESEVSDQTVNLLIEAADFDALCVRSTARALNLHSPSSYRFERGVDPEGIDWASRRSCELILEHAGGTLADGAIDVGQSPQQAASIVLRLSQLERILGIKIEGEEVQRILTALGMELVGRPGTGVEVIPPTWRPDLEREADLIEEVARIHGYDKIPEDAPVPVVASSRSTLDQLFDEVRRILTSAGFDEAMTISAVEPDQIEIFRPWSAETPLVARTPVLRRADYLRQTIVPSLLAVRRANENLFNDEIELFEIAQVYLPLAGKPMPQERRMLALCSGRDYRDVKGIVEEIVNSLSPNSRLQVRRSQWDLLSPARQAEFLLDDELLAVVGEADPQSLEKLQVCGPCTIAEIDLDVLLPLAGKIRKAKPLSTYPPVKRDVNIVVDDSQGWDKLEDIVRQVAGGLLEELTFQEEYRDAQRIGAGKKSLLFSFTMRAEDTTLTNEIVDGVRDKMVEELASQLGAEIRA